MTLKPVLLCLLLLPACSFGPDNDPVINKYALTWYCVSAEGCQRTEEAARIDRATITDFAFLGLTSTQDRSFDEQGELLRLDALPSGCAWTYYLSFFGHDLERSMLCYNPGGFELRLSIPDPDPATSSNWVVSGRNLSLL
jgi:hypothetical protein